MPLRAETGNAADPRQTRNAARRARRRRDRFDLAVRQVLNTPAGRQLFGDLEFGLMAASGMFQRNWTENSNTVHYNSGRREMGLEIYRMAVDIGGRELFERMEQECRLRADKDQLEADAVNADGTNQT